MLSNFHTYRTKLTYTNERTEKSVELWCSTIVEHNKNITSSANAISFMFLMEFSSYIESHPFWAAAPKGRCPVGHRGEFPDVRTSVHTSPPRPLSDPKSALSSPKSALSSPKSALSGPKSALSDPKSALSGPKSALSAPK